MKVKQNSIIQAFILVLGVYKSSCIFVVNFRYKSELNNFCFSIWMWNPPSNYDRHLLRNEWINKSAGWHVTCIWRAARIVLVHTSYSPHGYSLAVLNKISINHICESSRSAKAFTTRFFGKQLELNWKTTSMLMKFKCKLKMCDIMFVLLTFFIQKRNSILHGISWSINI